MIDEWIQYEHDYIVHVTTTPGHRLRTHAINTKHNTKTYPCLRTLILFLALEPGVYLYPYTCNANSDSEIR